jgi:equilibrative nucleoside transporter 1/2/3
LVPNNHRILQIGSFARVLFLPLFFFSVNPKLIESKALPMIFMFLLGITNGFISSQLMMFTPAIADLEDYERPTAGSAMSLSLFAGCAIGSLTALLLSQTYFKND